MVRQRDEDMLEPILPKHPPTEREVQELEAATAAAAASTSASVGTVTRPSWDRLVLIGCAVVATLALVIVALRTNSIANDQRVQTCQIRVYAAEQSIGSRGFSSGQQERLQRQLAECVGIDPPVDDSSD